MRILIATVLMMFLFPLMATAETQGSNEAAIATLQKETDAAIDRVVAIINQPVTVYTRLPDSNVGLFSPGWFQEGAVEPDFDKVDIRKFQTFPYNRSMFVSSNLNPTEMFRSGELEFNAMTKYFYLDRTRPKKKLTRAEMTEINSLYRLIGANRRKIASLKKG
jgi:hypothetical protein